MAARVARTEICDSGVCDIANLLVRGDQIEFVSTEQVRAVGRHPLDPDAMPSDIVLPKGFVLVHDTTGRLLDRCHFYVVKWSRTGTKGVSNLSKNELEAAKAYYNGARLTGGSVDIPEGPWHRDAKVAFIRYRRHGHPKKFEHPYEPAVFLYGTDKPTAWKIVLPQGCVVDARGFVWP
jgi:hypothetical protein